MKRVLIAVDNDPTAHTVLSECLELIGGLNAEIALLSVVDVSLFVTDGITPAEMTTMIKEEHRKNQQMLIGTLAKDKKIWTYIEEGKPFEVILKVADEWEADLIVLGTHGKKGISHLLMGSVAEKVVRNAAKPLLIIPAK